MKTTEGDFAEVLGTQQEHKDRVAEVEDLLVSMPTVPEMTTVEVTVLNLY